MLHENTILVVANHGPYLAVGFHDEDREKIATVLNVFHNYGGFEGEVQYKSDVFGYITGPQERAYGGLLSYFQTQGIQSGRKTRTRGADLLVEARRKANKVWNNRQHEPFMDSPQVTKREYSFPKFDNDRD